MGAFPDAMRALNELGLTALIREEDVPAVFTEINGSDATARALRRETGVTPARYAAAARRPESLPDDWYV